MRLLVIEDERKVADFVARGLRAERFAVDVAYDGASGWDMASGCDYDLVILDLMLPGLGGAEVLRRLRRAPTSRAGKKIDLTAKEYALLEYLAANAGRVLLAMMKQVNATTARELLQKTGIEPKRFSAKRLEANRTN